ncbi:PTS sugar transporter subunit IIA [Geosporobacter ferrireducens]|uniref:PTS fructose transporter subunit IIA n=1 Tax=Geosporobacter ferrireducens TaxID=1424294 RepID=A0A1D8GDA4_9FIRM|nr:fructose PTS transporter subunit IIA [Geosporobacter ferrireducens]AOT68862.1 PTS fructose transporter subunit IIA [Geosporobacter ferrireducens]MTI54905.1 PTS fructose transporter subunit IIA [Geosporobacter ferrireducens]
MQITDMLEKDLMILELKARNKEEVVGELVEALVKKEIVSSKDSFVNTVMEREKMSSTGIGMGIAIPHGKSNVVSKPSIVFGKSVEGIDYQSLDGEPSYIFFLIAVPEDSNNEHLKVLSQLSRRLMHEEVRKKLMASKKEAEVISAFQE